VMQRVSATLGRSFAHSAQFNDIGNSGDKTSTPNGVSSNPVRRTKLKNKISRLYYYYLKEYLSKKKKKNQMIFK
jgi:hypothetical protein